MRNVGNFSENRRAVLSLVNTESNVFQLVGKRKAKEFSPPKTYVDLTIDIKYLHFHKARQQIKF